MTTEPITIEKEEDARDDDDGVEELTPPVIKYWFVLEESRLNLPYERCFNSETFATLAETYDRLLENGLAYFKVMWPVYCDPDFMVRFVVFKSVNNGCEVMKRVRKGRILIKPSLGSETRVNLGYIMPK